MLSTYFSYLIVCLFIYVLGHFGYGFNNAEKTTVR